MDSRELHMVAIALRRQEAKGKELTPGQERFWDQIIGELEWRSARKRRGYKRCWCALCFFDPFAEQSVGDAL